MSVSSLVYIRIWGGGPS